MNYRLLVSVKSACLIAGAALLMTPVAALAQSITVSGSEKSDRWLHVRVVSQNSHKESVRVNVPLELAEKVLPAINQNCLHNGKVKFDSHETNGVDLRALINAVRSTKDGEFVTVQSDDSDVHVAKQGGYLIVHVTENKSWHSDDEGDDDADAKVTDSGNKSDKNDRTAKTVKVAKLQKVTRSHVEVKVPLKVVDALFSAGKNELDLLAAIRALSAQGNTELVSVQDDENTVRIWLDSKSGPE